MVRYLVIDKTGGEHFLPAANAFDMAKHAGWNNTGIPEHQALAAHAAAVASEVGEEDVADLASHAGESGASPEFLAAIEALAAAQNEPAVEVSTFVPVDQTETVEADDKPDEDEPAESPEDEAEPKTE